MTVGFIGSGNIAAAIARGLARSDSPPMLFSDGGSGGAARLAAEVGGEAAASNRELAERSDLVVLAVKPALLDEVGAEVDDAAPALLSVLGATTIKALERAFPRTPIVRAMPNLAVEVGRGVICWAAAPGAPDQAVAAAVELIQRLGWAVELPESQLDPATAIIGCSPAYLAVVSQALVEAGAAAGIPPQTAREMVAETLAGTAELLRGHTAGEVVEAVASPGGSTEAGLAALDQHGVTAGFAAAVEASLERMRAQR